MALNVPLWRSGSAPNTVASQLYSFEKLCTIMRACVWFTTWMARNDMIICPDLPDPTPQSISLAAAITIHIQHMVLRGPEDDNLIEFLLGQP